MNSTRTLMNRLLTIILLTFVSLAMSAENIGRRSAKQKAVTVMGAEAQLELAAVAEGSSPAYYVFNNTASAKGFVIVAGDEGNNDILGYATSGKFDADSLPPQLAFWLACYEEQLELIRQGGAAPYRSATIYPTIEPLVTTHWDQQSPYNKMNPMNPITNNQFPTTGCVATAMAQVMKYWSSDKATTDIPEYSYKLNSSGTIYTVNVSGLPATTINYSLLRNDYNSGDNDASAQEVARLMAYCGRAAKMAYMSTTASAVCRGTYLSEYFGYNTNQVTESREYYSSEEWDSLLYHELQASRPVIYSGARQDTSKEQYGHAFIVDGYKEGLFHINWGWSGRYDGYFKLSECNPYGSGTGAGTGRDGFSFRQIAVTHLTPGDVESIEPRGGESLEEGGLVVNGIGYEGEKKVGNELTLTVNTTNQGIAYYNRMYLFVDDKLTTGAGVWIDPGETDDVLLHIELVKAGVVALKLCAENDGSSVLWEESITVRTYHDPKLVFGTPEIDNLQDPQYNNISGPVFRATLPVTNEDTDPFDEQLTFILNRYVKPSVPISLDPQWDGVPVAEQTFDMVIPAGETKEITVSFYDLSVGERYWLQAKYYMYSKKDYVYVRLSDTYTLLPGETGIGIVRCDAVAIDGNEYYDLQGRRVTQPRKGGLYILRQQAKQ